MSLEIADCEFHVEFGIPYVWHKECGAQIIEYKRGQSINIHDLVTAVESSDHECDADESFEAPVTHSTIPVHYVRPTDPETGEELCIECGMRDSQCRALPNWPAVACCDSCTHP